MVESCSLEDINVSEYSLKDYYRNDVAVVTR